MGCHQCRSVIDSMRNQGEWTAEQGQRSKASKEETDGRRFTGARKELVGKKGKNWVAKEKRITRKP